MSRQSSSALRATSTGAPAPSRSSVRTAQPTEFVGSQTTPSTIRSVTRTGTVTAPWALDTVTSSPSTTPRRSASVADRRATARGAVPARNGSPSCRRPASSRVGQVARTNRPRASGVRASGDAAAPSPTPRSPVHGPSAVNCSWTCSWVRVSRKYPSSAASMSSTRWSLIALLSKASWNGRTRPSQLTNAPTFSACGATGRTTSATAVTAESRISSETTKVLARASSTPGWLRSAGSTPPMTSASISPEQAASMMPSVSRAAVSGSPTTSQTSATSVRAWALAAGRPPGSSAPSAPASRAPRSPARLGIHASLAPALSARAAAAVRAPGTVASRSPTRTTPPSCSASSAERPALEPPRSRSTVVSLPGRVGSSRAASLSRPRDAKGATAYTCVLLRRTPLRSRRKTIGDSSSGSNPTRRTALASSRSA